MKLDPCPWCGRQPRTNESKDYDNEIMVTIDCCHSSLYCAKIDAEEMWNWKNVSRS